MSNKKNFKSWQALRYNSGQAVIISVTLLLFIAMTLVGRATRPVQTDAQLARELYQAKRASALSDAGAEDLTYRIKRAKLYDSTEYVSLDGQKATTTITSNVSAGTKTVDAFGNILARIRRHNVVLLKNDLVTFNFGVQAGAGGLSMANSSSVLGNVYSNGTITGSGNYIYGNAVSAGSAGLINSIHATGTARAHTIQGSTIDKDAYYQVKTSTTVNGTSYPGSADMATTSFPIPDSQIAEWEADALAGGTISSPCPYIITTPIALGPKKIDCDMQVKGTTLTLTGPVWVVGNLSFTNSFHVKTDPSLGATSIMMIADKSSAGTTQGTISVGNSGDIKNNGAPGTAIYLISANTSAENGGPVIAIDMGNNVDNDAALYANHGLININQSGKLYMATGYKISLAQSAQIIYNSGIESTVFETGPGGSWDVSSWKESQ